MSNVHRIAAVQAEPIWLELAVTTSKLLSEVLSPDHQGIVNAGIDLGGEPEARTSAANE